MLNKIRNQMWTRKEKFLALSVIPVYFLIAGVLIQPLPEIGAGLIRIMEEPDYLITDYMVVGGMGAALVNASILMLICIGIIYALGMGMDGHTITSSFLMFGFSLFGKNLFNIWAILVGVCIYARYHKTSITRYIYIGFYGTSLSPLITQMMQLEQFSAPMRYGMCIILGMIMGFVLPPLCTGIHYAHKGYSLYNVGFAGGIIATIIVSIMKSFGLEVQSRNIWYTGSNDLFAFLLCLLFAGMVVIAIVMGRPGVWHAYGRILKSKGIAGSDYLMEAGLPAAILNMGINGLFVTGVVIAVGGDLNGPTIGGIMTVAGFSATGKHMRNIVPVMAGVYLAGFNKVWEITSPSAMLALLFSTTLAPIAGEFGVVVGVMAGYLHASVALNVGIVYGGMNLYNNGFAGGLVATFLVPVIQSMRDKRARARGGVSL